MSYIICYEDNDQVEMRTLKKEPEEPITVKREPQPHEMDRIVSAGSFGVLWNVGHPITGERMALKRISNVFGNLQMAKMIFREVRMLRTLKHDNIVTAMEIVQPRSMDHFEEVSIVLELMSTDLAELIYSEGPLTADRVHLFMYQLLRGLKYIHSAKVLHRDIKPGNILVSGDVLKICDFGLARAEEPDTSQPMSPQVVTTAYRAPELLLAEGRFHYGGGVDVWSVGCTFIELLTGKCFFDEPHFFQHLHRMLDLVGTPRLEEVWYACDSVKMFVATREPQPPGFSCLAKASPLATPEALDLISRMMTFDPERRISAAEALEHPYMNRGRELYHTGLCKCCGVLEDGERYYTWDFEPVASHFFDDTWERNIVDVRQAKEEMFEFIRGQVVHGQDYLSMDF